MATNASMGWASTVRINGFSYPVASESLARQGDLLRRDGLRGHRQIVANDAANAPYFVSGTIVIDGPTNYELKRIITLAGVNTAAGLTTLATFNCVVDRVGQVCSYNTCKINEMRITGRQGELLRCEIDIVGKEEKTGQTAPAEPGSNAVVPLVFSEVTVNLGGSARPVNEVTLTVNHGIQTGLFRNRTTQLDFPEGPLAVSMTTVHPFNAAVNTGLIHKKRTGVAGNLVLARCGTFEFGRLQCPDVSPNVQGKGEITHTINWTASRYGTQNTIEYV
jgi:hypothetical protein